MSFLSLFVKMMPYLWPFIREMIFGKKSIWSAFRDNKKKVLFAVLVVFSIGLNFVLVPRSVQLSIQYVNLERKYIELQKASSTKHPTSSNVEVKANEKDPNVVSQPTKVADAKPPGKDKKETQPPSISDAASSDHIRAQFDKIRQREETDH